MQRTRIPSPARSQGAITPRRKTRRTLSVGSPGRSSTSGRLTSIIDQFKEANRDSLAPSPLNKTVLTDNTDIEHPRRQSWWKKVNHSRNISEVLEIEKAMEPNNIMDDLEMEVLSQEKKNYTLDLPDSSGSESISSIVVPQRKLFTQKENVPHDIFKQILSSRQSLTRQNKTNVEDKTVNIGTKTLFGRGAKKSRPVFPAALLNLSPEKTLENKTKELATEVKAQRHNLFGHRPGTKRKNMFTDFIVSESEDEISDIQPKLFAFQRNTNPVRHSTTSRASRGNRESSPASSLTTDIEMEDWKLLPSSTMVEHQFEALAAATPGKKSRLSKLSEAKESDAGTNSNNTINKTKLSNKSTSKSKVTPDLTNKELESEKSSASKSYKSMVTENKDEVETTSRKQSSPLNNSKANSNQIRNTSQKTITEHEDNIDANGNENKINNQTQVLNKTGNRHLTVIDEKSREVTEIQSEANSRAINNQTYKINNDTAKADIFQDKENDDDENITLTYDDNEEPDERESHAPINKDKTVEQQIEELFEEGDVKLVEHISVKNANNQSELQNKSLVVEMETPNEKHLIQTCGKENGENTEIQTADFANNINITFVPSDDKGKEADQQKTEKKDVEIAIAEEEMKANPEKKLQKDQVSEGPLEIAESDNKAEQQYENQNADEDDQATEVVVEEGDGHTLDNQKAANRQENEELVKNNENEVQVEDDEEARRVDNEKEVQIKDNAEEVQLENYDKKEQRKDDEEEIQVEVDEEDVQVDDQEEDDEEEIQVEEDEEEIQVEEDEEEVTVEEDEEIQIEDDEEVEIEEDEEDQNRIEMEVESEDEQQQNESEVENEVEGDQNEDEIENENVDEEQKNEIEDVIEESEENFEGEVQESEQEEMEDTETAEAEAESPDTTGKSSQNDLKSPEGILHNVSNQNVSFIAKGRNTSIRKTLLKNLTIRQSEAPPRESTGLDDGTKTSSAEGSGWDSHRTTRKTLRQTFGKDFTPRKSLRTLVMEQSAKRQTAIDEANAKLHQANSTEIPGHNSPDIDVEFDNVDTIDESNHEISKRTRQTTLEMYLQKVKKDLMESKRKVEAEARNLLQRNSVQVNSLSRSQYKSFRKTNIKLTAPKAPKAKRAKGNVVPLEDLPEEFINDLKYRPPKRYRPRNAPWITKRLYKFLETKLEAKYDYKARLRAEKLVETLYEFTRHAHKQRVVSPHAIAELKHEMARLDVVKTHLEFYNFFHDYMPHEVIIKVVPDIVNDIPLPRNGPFTDIID